MNNELTVWERRRLREKYLEERRLKNEWCDYCEMDGAYCMCGAVGNYAGTNK